MKKCEACKYKNWKEKSSCKTCKTEDNFKCNFKCRKCIYKENCRRKYTT